MITEDQWQRDIPKKIMSLPGMKTDHDSVFVCEPIEEGASTYFKFMSDHGVTDDYNGKVFADYLRANNCVITTSRPRSMIVLNSDITRLFL
jgi:hypothetical protein